MEKITHFDLLQITAYEKELKLFLKQQNAHRICSPKQEKIDNILNYSKALSIRKSKTIEFISIVLN
jgi:hypothetical protein